VYWYFNQWEQAGATEKILPVVRAQLRVQEGRNPERVFEKGRRVCTTMPPA